MWELRSSDFTTKKSRDAVYELHDSFKSVARRNRTGTAGWRARTRSPSRRQRSRARASADNGGNLQLAVRSKGLMRRAAICTLTLTADGSFAGACWLFNMKTTTPALRQRGDRAALLHGRTGVLAGAKPAGAVQVLIERCPPEQTCQREAAAAPRLEKAMEMHASVARKKRTATPGLPISEMAHLRAGLARIKTLEAPAYTDLGRSALVRALAVSTLRCYKPPGESAGRGVSGAGAALIDRLLARRWANGG